MKFEKKITIGFFVFLCSITIVISECRDEKLLKSNFVTKGLILDVVKKRNSGENVFIEYKFNVKGFEYYSNQGLPCPLKFIDSVSLYLKGYSSVVVYNEDNPGNNRILLTLKDFRKYRVRMKESDSLLILKISSFCNKK